MELAAICFGQDPGWRRRFFPCHPVTATYRCRVIGDFCEEFGVPRQMKAGAPCESCRPEAAAKSPAKPPRLRRTKLRAASCPGQPGQSVGRALWPAQA